MTICSVNNVTKSFGGNIIFENISLEIKKEKSLRQKVLPWQKT